MHLDTQSLIFFGTPEFAVPSLRALVASGRSVKLVVTQPDKPFGRGKKDTAPPIKLCANAMGLEIFQPPSVRKEHFFEHLKHFPAPLHVVVAYGKIFPKRLLDIPQLTLNVHASLLPKYRGAAPIARTIENGDKQTGVSIMKLVEEMDAGDFALQKKCDITASTNHQDLTATLAQLGAEALIEALDLLEQGDLAFTQQDVAQVSFAPPVDKSEGRIDFNLPGQKLHDRCRAFTPWPGLYCFDTEQMIKIGETRLTLPPEAPSEKEPGELLMTKKQLWVKTKDTWLEVLQLQAEGKKMMETRAFLASYCQKNVFRWHSKQPERNP